MNINAVNSIIQQADEALAEHRLHDALQLAEAIAKDVLPSKHINIIDDVRRDYDAMLHFVATGGTDQQLRENLNAIYQRAAAATHGALLSWYQAKGVTRFGRLYANFNSDGEMTVAALFDQLRRISIDHMGQQSYHTALDAAFGMLWIIDLPENSYKELAQQITTLDNFARHTLIASAMLGALERFDIVRVRLLTALAAKALDQRSTLSDDADVAPVQQLVAASLCGLMLVYCRWHMLLHFYTDAEDDIRNVFCHKATTDDITTLHSAAAQTLMTPQVEKRLEKSLPDINKQIKKKINWLMEQAQEGDESDESKPNIINSITIDPSDKLFKTLTSHYHEMHTLAMAGFDINYQAFKRVRNAPFFQHPAHWFYPFSTQVPDIRPLMDNIKGKKIIALIMNQANFCDTDKYVYISMFGLLQNEQTFTNHINNELEQLQGELDEDFDIAHQSLPPYTNFMQSCYRMLIQPECAQTINFMGMLDNAIMMPRTSMFAPCFRSYDDIRPAVESLLMLDDAKDALALIVWAEDNIGSTATLLRAKAAALIQSQMWQRAIEALARERLLADPTDENRLMMAQCHEALNQWEAAASELDKIVAAQAQTSTKPSAGDPSLLQEIALCYIKAHRWDDAANRLFQLEFAGHATRIVQRSIGWCSLHQGKYARAEQYYSRLVEARRPSWEDIMNLAHAQWLQGRRIEALDTYRRFATAFDKASNKQGYSSWREALDTDIRQLLAPAAPQTELDMLTDLISLE